MHRQRLVLGSLLLVVGTCVAAPPASAHDGSGSPPIQTAEDHARQDAVVLAPEQERMLQAHTRSATAAAVAAAAAAAGPPSVEGSWSPPADWPLIGMHLSLLPNGRVLAFDIVGPAASTQALVWDRATATNARVDLHNGSNLFCAGFAHLPDGRVFVAGGNTSTTPNGITATNIFDQARGWAAGPTMRAERWYPSVTPLPNGEMLISSGKGLPAQTPEVRTTAGTLRALTGATRELALYPWMDVTPTGGVLNTGPDPRLRELNTSGTGAWTARGTRDTLYRDYGSRAVFDIGKVLVAGGGPSSPTAAVINFNSTTPVVTPTAPMEFGRRQHNLTILADGSVLATGGNSSGAPLVDLVNAVYPAERWNPATGQWTRMAPMSVTRQYHSAALLLPDGRVLSAGGGICGECTRVGYEAKNAEIYSPPYLFRADGTPAARPSISYAASGVPWSAKFGVYTPQAASISKVALIRLGSVTHSTEMEQRYIPLSFTRGSGVLTATSPANANIAPPGHYMLVVVNNAGVPSVARMIRVRANVTPRVTLTSPAAGASFASGTPVPLAATASDPDGTINKVEFFDGTTKLGEDTTAPYALSWSSASPGTHLLKARATDNHSAATTSAGISITVA